MGCLLVIFSLQALYVEESNVRGEPPRVYRRQNPVRGWSESKVKQ
jgi:hypothetical protein